MCSYIGAWIEENEDARTDTHCSEICMATDKEKMEYRKKCEYTLLVDVQHVSYKQ